MECARGQLLLGWAQPPFADDSLWQTDLLLSFSEAHTHVRAHCDVSRNTVTYVETLWRKRGERAKATLCKRNRHNTSADFSTETGEPLFCDDKRSFTALRSTIHASRSCGVDKHESALDKLPCEASSRRQLLRLFVRKKQHCEAHSTSSAQPQIGRASGQ